MTQHHKYIGSTVILVVIFSLVINASEEMPQAAPESLGNVQMEGLIAVPPPPFSEDVFPCSDCHAPDDEVDTTRHDVDFHDTVVFNHDAQNRWCLDCHDLKDRDKLHLADGRLIPFEESYRLCGQCHGQQLKNWKAGDHGRRIGFWNGKKEYLLCAHCHDPHSPQFKPIKPLPAPIRQELIR